MPPGSVVRVRRTCGSEVQIQVLSFFVPSFVEDPSTLETLVNRVAVLRVPFHKYDHSIISRRPYSNHLGACFRASYDMRV